MKLSLINLYQQQRDLHKALVEITDILIADAAKGDLHDLADTAYAMREIAAFADEIRKRANRIGEHAQKVACFVAVQVAGLNDDPAGLKIKTEYCTATPTVKQIVQLPDKRKDQDNYAALMDHYGIPKQLYDASQEGIDPIVVAYWPGVMSKVNADRAAGKPTPPGIDPTKFVPEYRLTIRGSKGVLE